MLLLFALTLFRGVVGEIPAERTSYNGQQVLKCKFDAAAMPKISDSLDVWGVLADETIDVRVKTPAERALLESLLDECTVTIQDLESVVQASHAENLAARAKAAAWFDAYHTLAEITQWYRNLTSQYAWITGVNIGTTAGGNTLTCYVLNPSRSTNAPIIFLDAGIHAREWIAPATLNFITEGLINEYMAGNTQVRNIMDRSRIVILPIVNPDGYAFTWNGDRMWRKNRNRYSGTTCYGIDNNRNFASFWGQGGSSTNPCSETYMGPSSNSEAETRAIVNYASSLQTSGPIYAYVSYHSYSQLILRPWGYTSANSPNETYLSQLGATWSANIRSVSGRTYTSQKSNSLYITTGSSSDYMYDNTVTNANRFNGINYRVASYTIELRPQDGSAVGFQLPPAEIIPTGQENYPALKNFLQSVLNSPVIKTA